MDKKPKKELIEGIRDFLKDIEEPYDRREWEHFQQQRKSKKRHPIPLFIKLIGAAASLCLVVYASVKIGSFFERKQTTETKVIQQIPHPPSNKEERQTKDTLILDSNILEINHVEKLDRKIPKVLRSAALPPNVKRERLPEILMKDLSASSKLSISDSKAKEKQILKNKKSFLATSKKSKRLKLPTFKPLFGENTNISNINVGINVNPAFTNKGFSFGAGLSTKIPLSTRISAELGANYSRIAVGTAIEPDLTDTTHIQTIGIRHTVGMISVPVSLNYAISESFSFSLGVTPFKAITDRRKETQQWYRWETANASTGDSTRLWVGERREFQYADSTYKNNSYLGFVQLSGRISPPFLKKFNTVVEPYIAVPIGKLHNDPYKWTNGGVSLRIYLCKP